MARIRAQLIQHPVGQGGLFSGGVGTSSLDLRWAYDCGSNQTDALTREIGAVASEGDLDLLFLSHLDSDHISGVDDLLTRCKVKEVVLPYMEPELILAIVARDIARGRLNGLLLDAAMDISGWLGGRGVELVTFVRPTPGDDDPGTAPPTLEPAPEGPGDGRTTAKWVPGPEPFASVATVAPPTVRVQIVPASAALQLFAGHRVLDWVLIPHVYAAPSALMAGFKSQLTALFGDPLDVTLVTSAARSAGGRRKLRDCYDALWLDHNLVSMTLYAGPLHGDGLQAYVQKGKNGTWAVASGWLLTGDAHLDSQRRRAAFLSRYSRVMDKVAVLMLPHHGSAANFDLGVIKAMTSLRVAFAAAGPNSYNHPHNSVIKMVRSQSGVTFHQVSRRPSKRLTTTVFVR